MRILKRLLFFIYALLAYVSMLITFIYLILFIGNIGLVNGIDGIPQRPFFEAIGIDLGLMLLFFAQHSIMARQWFKRRWVTIIPRQIERSTYVFCSCAALFLMMYLWEPLGGRLWNVETEWLKVFLFSVYFFGWTLMWTASCLINHWDLFGMRHVYMYLLGRPYTALNLEKPFLYKSIRHPLYLGLVLAFWATPTMTVTHFIFSLTFTIYILFGIQLEEKDLIADFGDRYREYRKQVPMILPFFK